MAGGVVPRDRQATKRPQQDLRGRAAVARRLCNMADLVYEYRCTEQRSRCDQDEHEGLGSAACEEDAEWRTNEILRDRQ